jgi:prephenate dehydratase
MASREQPSVAYLGPRSTFTNEVALKHFPESEFFLTPKSTIRDVLTAVQSGCVDRGVVPFENSSNGPVLNTLDLFADRENQFPDVHVCGEAYLNITHCLLGHTSFNGLQTPPLTPNDSDDDSDTSFDQPESLASHRLKHIKHIYSHPQAFGQCERFLSKYLPNATYHEVSSTALAARLAAQDPRRASTSLGNAAAARDVGLTVIAGNVQDAHNNETRFLVLKRFTPTWHYEPSWALESTSEEKRKMLVSFSVAHSHPGALAGALAVFQQYGLNLTSIGARPSRAHSWHYRHFVEFEWRKDEDGGECPVDGALKTLSSVTRDWRCHGAWGETLEW